LGRLFPAMMADPPWGKSAGTMGKSIDWFKGRITGKNNISWENLWFLVDSPFN